MDESLVIKHGDSRSLLNDVPDQSVDLILTDPPYKLESFTLLAT